MTKFVYNNAKNINTSYTLFKLNYGYYLWISYKNDISLCSKLKLVDKCNGLVTGLGLVTLSSSLSTHLTIAFLALSHYCPLFSHLIIPALAFLEVKILYIFKLLFDC